MSSVKERNYHFDNIKALLIFLVVFGHVLKKFGYGSSSDFFYDLIFSFHMPAFIFVSGYFARTDTKRALAKLVPLYLIFQIVQILECYFLNWASSGRPGTLYFQIFKPRWTLWYLLALIFFQLLLPVFETNNLRHQIYYIVFAVALGILIGLNHDTDNFMAMSRIFVFLPFYLFGYYENKNRILERFLRDRVNLPARVISALLGVGIIVVFILFHMRINAAVFYGKDPYEDVFSLIGRVVATVLAIAWIIILLIWVPKGRIPGLDKIGKNTLPVYLLHSLIILALLETPLRSWMNGNLFGLILLAVILTFVLSRNVFEKALRKIAIPIRREEKKHAEH